MNHHFFTVDQWKDATKNKRIIDGDGNAFAVVNGISEYQVFPRKEGKDLPTGTEKIKWLNV